MSLRPDTKPKNKSQGHIKVCPTPVSINPSPAPQTPNSPVSPRSRWRAPWTRIEP